MPANWNQPITSDLRAAVLQSIRDMQIALAKMLDGETLTGTPTNAIRYNSGASQFERWNGTTWSALPLNFLPLAGGTLTGGLSGTSGAFSSLTVGGSAVWHAGNFTPSSKLDAAATAARANGLVTANPGIGQGGAWVTTADLLFHTGANIRTVWHDANFDPATKQNVATAWNTGNFNPATKQDVSTAWNTGNLNPALYALLSGASFTSNVSSATQLSAPTLFATGASAAVYMHNRQNTAQSWAWYVDSNIARLYSSVIGDRVTVNTSGDMSITGAFTASGNITAFSDARLKESIEPAGVSLDMMLTVQPVKYRRIDTGAQEVGVLAHEVENVLPRVVRRDDRGMRSVDYGRFAAVAVLSLAAELRLRGVL